MITVASCVIIDDEPLAHDVLQRLITEDGRLECAGSFTDTAAALRFIRGRRPELLLLDIEMPAMNGLDLIAALDYKPYIIITTAHDSYALAGFEHNVQDFLLKPISAERFRKAISRYEDALAENIALNDGYIMIREGKKMYNIRQQDIIWIESSSDYIRIQTNTRTLLVYHTIKGMQQRLSPRLFMRVHHSFLVNLTKVQYLEGNFIAIGNREIPIGESYRSKVKACFMKRM